MSDWEPATEAELAMRDALLTSDQEQYFRILARMDLLLPVSVEALAGRAPMGWGTWTTGNRTHILAFTSPDALRLCLNEAGTFRAVPFHSLAADWPNYEWWLAINPGLPIEAYLPSWFVTQLTRGDVRLPGRSTLGSRARMAQSDLTAAFNGRVRAAVPAPPTMPAPLTVPAPPTMAAPPAMAAPPTMAAPPAASPPPTTPPKSPAPPTIAPLSPPPIPPAFEEYAARREALRMAGSARREDMFERPEPPFRPEFAGRRYFPHGPEFTHPSPSAGVSAAGAATSDFFNGHAPVTETVEAEIIDYPPASATARVHGHVDSARPDQSRPSVVAAVAFSAGRTAAAGMAPPTAGPTAGQSAARAGKIVKETHDAEIVSPAESWSAGFVPANETESSLLAAAGENNTDAFLSTLLLARVILSVPPGTPTTIRPRDRDFPWQIQEMDGQRYVAVYTSPGRLAEHARSTSSAEPTTISVNFVQLIGAWPDEAVSFAVNPGSPVGATLPGSQIVALASWAADVGLREEPTADVVVAAKRHESTPVLGVAGAPTSGAERATVMQRTVPHAQVPFYLERGYDRVAGFVNRASEVKHLTSPKVLYRALGLTYRGSPFADEDAEVHVLRWVGHRADLYRLPYGGQHEAAMRAMQGWVIERPPFRGNGFAPSDTDVIAEFKVDSVRLPHGAQMWRLAKDGTEALVATFDADAVRWTPATLGGAGA
jgi:hypothetical protein